MRERPILFSGAMVRAIIDGRKTQTRRVLKFQPLYEPICRDDIWSDYHCDGFHCPYGQPGDRLWVREACWIWGRWVRNGTTKTGRQKWRFRQTGAPLVRYEKPELTIKRGGGQGWVYRHARFMPRLASRILLEVTGVRVERVQEISEADAIAEGATFLDLGKNQWGNKLDGWSMDDPHPRDHERCLGTAQYAFANYINRLHGGPNWNFKSEPSLWDANPWIWVIEFKRI